MTDHCRKQFQRRQRPLSNQNSKKLRFLFMALVLIVGTGAFLFHKERFTAISKIMIWLKENKPEVTKTPTSTASPRGNIYDRNFRPLAATYETYTIYARPLEIEDPETTTALLSEILSFDKKNILTSLKSERGFVWIARGIDQELADTIKAQNIKGVYQVVETKRFYPNYETAAHAVGFVEDGQGLDGIEFQYNTLLRGDEISKSELESLRFVPNVEFEQTPSNLVLNLDLLIQSKIEHYLTKRVKITGATSGCALVMNANTGAILGMASFPAFNPNRYWEFSSSALNNHVISEPVYPGELALIFQEAAAINLKNERKSQLLKSEAGTPLLVIEPETLKRRKLSLVPQITPVDPDYFSHFSRLLGFNRKLITDLPLKNETPETQSLLLTDPDYHSSALRLLTGFTALVNNGRVVTPQLLDKSYQDGNVDPLEPKMADSNITVALHPETSKDLVDFLASKWLKSDHISNTSKSPLFLEAHRFSTPAENITQSREHDNPAGHEGRTRITQSLMLGAIPGKNPKLTMIAVLSYPDNSHESNVVGIEPFGNKLTILKPAHDMVQKMLFVYEQSPPVPSADFWSNNKNILVGYTYPNSPDEKEYSFQESNHKQYMPDVTGKSLRAGLQVLQNFNLDIKIVGSGQIIAQQPVVGTELKNGSKCLLKMAEKI